MASIEELDQRIQKLEQNKGKFSNLFLQYLLSPLLLLLIGFFLNARIEDAKQKLQSAELELKRIGAAQEMLKELFSGTPARAFIAERLLTKVIDKETSDEIKKIVETYYVGEIESKITNVDNISQITSAAKEIQSEASKKILETVEKAQFHVVVASVATEQQAISTSKSLIAQGYNSESYLTPSGVYAVTLGSYALDEAMKVREKAMNSRVAPKDTWMSLGKSWLKRVYP
jgi:hypothetical protein